MEILEQPELFSPVGGLLTNPVRYRIATATSFVSVEVQADGATISRLKASTRNGVAMLDISSLLRSHLSKETRSLAFSCIFTDAAGVTLSDAQNVRYAVYAALPFGVSDYSQYAATGSGHQAKFATHFEQPVLFEGQVLELTAAVGNVYEMYLEREYYNGKNELLERRADLITDRYKLASFRIDIPGHPVGTRYINVRLTNEYNPWVAEVGEELYDWAASDFADADWF